jgi:hypothetical protein
MSLTRRDGDAGFATAEAAVVLPTLFLLLTLAVGVLLTIAAQTKCVDAAHETARLAARGETDVVAIHAGTVLAPAGSRVSIARHDGLVEVTVRAQSHPFGLLPGIPLDAVARAELEGP